MSDMLNTSVSGLMAFQQELDTTSNNIANASTPGYSRESVNLVSVPGPQIGQLSIGNGVAVNSVQRIFNQTVASQVVSATSAYNQLNSFSSQAAQIDNLLGSTTNGLSTQLQSLVSALQTVANSPTASASRQAFLSQAQQLVSNLQSDDGSLQTLNLQANTQMTSDASQVTALAQSIATLNKQIMADTSPSAQAPGSLLDQRNQLINQLATYANVTTTQQSDGSVNVYIGSGQTLVTGTTASSLSTIANPYDPSEDDLAISTPAGLTDVTAQISGGTLGGTLQFRSQMLDPARDGLGQIALVLSSAVNTQNQAGLDQSGNPGQAVFAVGAVQVLPSSSNAGTPAVTATVSDANAVTANNYILRYDGTNWTLSNASTGAPVTMTGNGSAGNPFSADGMSLVVAAGAQAGDSYRISPTRAAVAGMQVLLTDPSQLAAAAPLLTSATTGNTGSGSIDAGSVPNPATWVRGDYTLSFTAAAAYQITNAVGTVVANGAYTAGAPINFNGMQVTLSGAPATGDSFAIDDNASGSGDNRNAVAMAGLLDQPLIGGNTSINGAVNQLVTSIGIKTSQAQAGTTAQQAVLTDASNAQQSVSGVNLDEEAANLVQYQQAYQAAAEAIKVASTLFQSVLSAVQS
ncbi:MAG TPA: flagellar hook-associated protein FlgK [Steroidobacteraceae bacterium]|jgi:flagellar hook-associated protein 1 FlgK